MGNASKYPCEILYRPTDPKYDESIRLFQGCPTLAVTRGGRIYLGWYAGGTKEPHMDNYNLLVYSDDEGKTWSSPLLVIPSSYEMSVHALDIQLFIDREGALHVCWVQNNTVKEPREIGEQAKSNQPNVYVDGYRFNDFGHAEWEIVCHNPDSDEPQFSAPKFMFYGFLRCKPTFLKNGDILYFNYDQLGDKYAYSISSDDGKSFERKYGSVKLNTMFDESMAYECKDGSIRMFARSKVGEIAESISRDGGNTWNETQKSGIVASDTRFYVSRLSSGRILLIYNEHPTNRTNMTAALSEDDGVTWQYKTCLDTGANISYPDADEKDGVIYLTYDNGRTKEREILFAKLTEEDIINGNEIEISIVSKP